ncbi:Competence protein (plasmid) [Paenibacillus larvae subsp. larvae]|uniref:Competence protein n=2 Tax=Paenibacillus larvae TaxID=1464 RepID=A0A2L1U7J9_9BACL|nr:Competence protein [Paenibacillus larvae subsp. larvae]
MVGCGKIGITIVHKEGSWYYLKFAIYENNKIFLDQEFSKYPNVEVAIEEVRKKSRKKAYTCPFCGEYLFLRAGTKYDPHFAHSRDKSCLMAQAYEQYEQQVERESPQHSVIRETVFDELKTQEKYKPGLTVEYGYKAKADEHWKYVPDIIINKGAKEIGISILTDVHHKGDKPLAQMIRKRNEYFKEKGMLNIWFIEYRELSVDLSNRTLFLWESETLLTTKTTWDHKWDVLVKQLSGSTKYKVSKVFNYNERVELQYDVRSLYYVRSKGDNISFYVYRLILDELRSPYRGFAVSTGYKMQLSKALIVHDQIRLANEDMENQQMELFKEDFTKGIDHIVQAETCHKESENPVLISSILDKPAAIISPIKQQGAEKDLPLIHWDDGTFHHMIGQLKRGFITEHDAAMLERYLRHNRELVVFKGVELPDIQKMANEALGKIPYPEIRKHLVEIALL